MKNRYFRKALPDSSLQDYIKGYTFIDIPFEQASQMEFLALPSCGTRMILFLGEPSTQKIGSKFEKIEYYSLTGLYTKPHLFIPTQSLQQVVIHFAPWGIQPFLDFPLSEITNARADLNSIFKHEIDALCANLHHAADLIGKQQALDQFFQIQLLKAKGIDKRIKPIARYIFDTHGTLRLSDLSNEACIGQRTIQRLIHNAIGVNYKFFAMLIRVEYVRQLLKRGNVKLTDVAIKTGYYDQAHFIHEFQSIYGESPGAYVKKQQKMTWNKLES